MREFSTNPGESKYCKSKSVIASLRQPLQSNISYYYRHLVIWKISMKTKFCLSYHGLLILGLTRESLFEHLARSETRFLDPKFSRDFCETCESKLVARLTSCESHRQKFRSENREKRVLLRNFVAKIAFYESLRKKFCSETRENHY